jgi:hypothetical protein
VCGCWKPKERGLEGKAADHKSGPPPEGYGPQGGGPRFEDAGQEPMPDMLGPRAWDKVKQFFCREVPPLLGRFEGESGA